MMFFELLFWKNAATSEEVGRRYNWLVGSCNACGAVADAAGLSAVQHLASSQQLGCSSRARNLQQCRVAFVGFPTRAAFRLKRMHHLQLVEGSPADEQSMLQQWSLHAAHVLPAQCSPSRCQCCVRLPAPRPLAADGAISSNLLNIA